MELSILKNRLSRPWLALALIPLTAVVIYSNIYHSPFIYDDDPNIGNNYKIRHLGNYLSLDQIFKPRNLVNLTFALNYKYGDLNVFGYHLVNILIHILNGFIVYFLALTIFKQLAHFPKASNSVISQSSIIPDKSGFPLHSNNHQSLIRLMSLFAALIFIAHPIQTQAVTYTIQRYASMAAMFYMASVLFYLKARVRQQRSEGGGRRADIGGQRSEVRGQKSEVREHRAWRREQSTKSLQPSVLYIFSILCGMLAVLSKLNTASLPGAILLAEYLLIDQTWQGWKKKILWFVLAFTLWGLFILYVVGFFTGGFEGRGLLEDVSKFAGETTEVSRWHYLCTQFNVLVIYIRLLFLPVGQSLYYIYPFKNGFFDGYTPLSFLFLAGIVGVGIWNIKKSPIISFAIFWFFITLSVESSIVPIREAMYEHRLYLPMFGFAFGLSYLLFYLMGYGYRQFWRMLISLLIIISLGTTTYLRNRVWQGELKMWNDMISKNPENYRAWHDLGYAYHRIGKIEKAIVHFKKAVSIKPDYPGPWNGWGGALIDLGKPEVAISKFKEAIRIKEDSYEAWSNWGVALRMMGRLKEAIPKFEMAVNINPNFVKALINLGVSLNKTGRYEEAILRYKTVLDLNSKHISGWNNWGVTLLAMGKPDDAIQKFKKVISINPDYAAAWNYWGIALGATRQHEQATIKFKEAININPDNPEAWYNWGVALFKLGNFRDALSKFEKAVSLKSNYAGAWYNWGVALIKLKKPKEALSKFKKVFILNPGFPNVQKNIELIQRITKKNRPNIPKTK